MLLVFGKKLINIGTVLLIEKQITNINTNIYET